MKNKRNNIKVCSLHRSCCVSDSTADVSPQPSAVNILSQHVFVCLRSTPSSVCWVGLTLAVIDFTVPGFLKIAAARFPISQSGL